MTPFSAIQAGVRSDKTTALLDFTKEDRYLENSPPGLSTEHAIQRVDVMQAQAKAVRDPAPFCPSPLV
jgi:hypothetical protein